MPQGTAGTLMCRVGSTRRTHTYRVWGRGENSTMHCIVKFAWHVVQVLDPPPALASSKNVVMAWHIRYLTR
eukprot:13966-Chlamydomonas_euryale.AAC.8